MKDFDGAIPKLFIESAKSISYMSLLEWKHLRRGAQTPSRNEAEAHGFVVVACPSGARVCSEAVVGWLQ